MTWTKFWDMNSGGGKKLGVEVLYIEAPESEAVSVFYAKFDRNPERGTCTCCGEDYAISQHASLEDASAYHRGCRYQEGVGYVEERDPERTWNPYLTLADYLASGKATVVRADEITDDERRRRVPAEGYVWAGDDE